jgi:hypothetical protein
MMRWDDFASLTPGEMIWKFHASEIAWVSFIVYAINVREKFDGRPSSLSLHVWSPRHRNLALPWRIERECEYPNWFLDPDTDAGWTVSINGRV